MIYEGTVVKVVDFGAFVNFYGAKDGLVHVSQLATGPREQALRRRRGRPEGEGQADGLRRPRQGPPVDARGRPGHGRGPGRQGAGGGVGGFISVIPAPSRTRNRGASILIAGARRFRIAAPLRPE